MKSAIVVVFSLSGNTRRVGAEIAQRIGCPIVEIAEARSRRGALGYLCSGFEALSGRLPQIQPVDQNLGSFSVIVIGTPVWVGHVSSPVRSFVSRHRSEIGALAAFCTMGGRDPGNTFADIASVAGKALVTTLAASEHELGSPQHAARLGEFIAAIGVLREGS
ncbi:MAG: flavodoxin family protein [Betaproteobacteria bacterium]